jgi:hypothetical protein
MLPLGVHPLRVRPHARRVGDTELGGHVVQHHRGHIKWVVQELAQIPKRGQLEHEAQPVGVPTLVRDQVPVLVVEHEKLIQLIDGR